MTTNARVVHPTVGSAVTQNEAIRPLRVLHVIDLQTENSYFNNLFDHTDPRNITHLVATFGSGGAFQASLQARGCTAYAIGCASRRLYPEAAKRIRAIIRSEKIDIVHTHLFDPTFVAVNVAMACGRRVVITRHHSDPVHRIRQPLKRWGYLLAEKWVSWRADHIIAPSKLVRDILVNRERVPAAKVSVIPHPQTLERFERITAESVERVKAELQMADSLAFVCVSRLVIDKGHLFLFDALSQLVCDGLDAVLYLVGKGPDEQLLKSLARERGIDGRVRFLGWRDDALAIIAAADVVVHPSLHEALPQAVIESIMLERPLVATDVGGVRDILGNSEYGLIVPPNDAEVLRRGLRDTIKDLDSARERARRGRRFVLEYMDAGRVARDYAACYRKVASLRPLSALAT